MNSGLSPRNTKGKVFLYLLFLIGLLSIFVLQNHRDGFGRGHHGFLSSHGATLAKNLSLKSNLLIINDASLIDNNIIIYDVYNRFPIFPFLIIKLVFSVFEPNLSWQIYAARQLMNFFLSLSIVLIFLTVKQSVKEVYLSLSIAFMTFSSFYILYYGDMIFNDIPALFGFSLALYVVTKCRTGNLPRKYLILMAMLAISMGWQPYAVFLTWFFLDLFNFPQEKGNRFRQFLGKRSSLALISSIAWGIIILGGQVTDELLTVGSRFWHIGTWDSMGWRLGLASPEKYLPYKDILKWSFFLGQQSMEIAFMFLPAFKGSIIGNKTYTITWGIIIFILFVLSIRKIILNFTSTELTTLAIIFLSGFFWSLPMKHFVTFHDFQAIFYLGIPVITYIGLSFYSRWFNSKIFAVLVVLFFIFNLHYINARKNLAAPPINQVTSEFQNIYNLLPKPSKVYFDGNKWITETGYHGIDFYLSGHYFTSVNKADYIISTNRNYNHHRLTNNPKYNLFKR